MEPARFYGSAEVVGVCTEVSKEGLARCSWKRVADGGTAAAAQHHSSRDSKVFEWMQLLRRDLSDPCFDWCCFVAGPGPNSQDNDT